MRRSPNVGQASEEYSGLAKAMAKSGNYPHAAFCCKAAARCERALEDPTAEADLLVQGGELQQPQPLPPSPPPHQPRREGGGKRGEEHGKVKRDDNNIAAVSLLQPGLYAVCTFFLLQLNCLCKQKQRTKTWTLVGLRKTLPTEILLEDTDGLRRPP